MYSIKKSNIAARLQMTSMAFKGQVYTERATTMFGSTRDRNVNKFNNTVYIFFIIHNNVSHIICSIIILYTAVFFKNYINVYLILESVIFNVTEYVLSKNEDFWSIFFFCCVSKKNKIKTRLKIYVITIKISNCVTFLVILYFIRRFY